MNRAGFPPRAAYHELKPQQNWAPMKFRIPDLRFPAHDLFTLLPVVALVGGTLCLVILALVV
jgi:hypothetical protein